MRLFVAINLNSDIRKALSDAQTQLKNQARSGDYTRAGNLHLTLAFIGEVENALKVKDSLARLKAEPFALALSGADHFEDLYFVGIADDGRLRQLANDIRQLLIADGLPCDAKPFLPHITIARRVEPTDKVTLQVPFVGMMVDRVSLMKSERINGVLTYSEIGRVMLNTD